MLVTDINDITDFIVKPVQKRVPLAKDLKLREWILNLVETNQCSSWGWNRLHKYQELAHPQTNLILVQSRQTNEWIGMAAYRHTHESTLDSSNERSVIYIYELQVSEEWQRKGIGKALINVLEQMAQQESSSSKPIWMMLTCFKMNQEALRFYHRHGFKKDEISPPSADYTILSKLVL